MKPLLSLFFLAVFGLSFAQSPLPISTQKVLLGFDGRVENAEFSELLSSATCFLPFEEGNFVKGRRQYIAWFDPMSAQAPRTAADVEAILDLLRASELVLFANPFFKGENGSEIGLTNQVRIRFAEGASKEGLSEMNRALGYPAWHPDFFLPNWLHFSLQKDAPYDPLSALQVLAQFPGVEKVEPDYLFQINAATNDFYFYQQWSLENTGSPVQGNGTPGADMSVPEAWALTTGDPEIRIGIIDSGVDTAHPDLKDNLLPGFDATGGGSMGYPNLNFPNDAHGTNCAGIAAAKGDNSIGIAGVCYDCSIVPIKLFTYINNPFGSPLPFATGSDMADAISWAWQNGEVDLISNSWGITDPLIPVLPNGTGIVEDAIDMALDSARNGKGIPMFFSSGNEGDAPIWPGRRARLFSVNASSMCDERKSPNSCDGQNWEGNWGDSLDVTAPGVQVAATDMTGSDGYTSGDYSFDFGGTSAACPNAAGVMGLVMSVYPGLSLEEAHDILEGTCDKVGGYTYQSGYPSGTWSAEMGYGRINAFAALQSAVLVAQPEALTDQLNLLLYPNPASKQTTLSCFFRNSDHLEVILSDIKGAISLKLISEKVPQGSYSKTIDLGALYLPNGIYTLNVKSNHKQSHLKLLINK